jgi:putative transposase
MRDPSVLRAHPLRSYPAAKTETSELSNVKHVFVKTATRLNNRAENSPSATRARERRMRGFRDLNAHSSFSRASG